MTTITTYRYKGFLFSKSSKENKFYWRFEGFTSEKEAYQAIDNHIDSFK